MSDIRLPDDNPREILKRIGAAGSAVHQTIQVLELVTRTSGLGEVLQDYAVQNISQLRAILQAGEHVSKGTEDSSDRQALQNIHFILKSARSVLERVPDAMRRNKSEWLGEKERLSCDAVTAILRALLDSPDIALLLADEEAGGKLAALVPEQSERLLAAAGE